MKCGCTVRDWCSLQVTRSLWLPFVGARIAPDCLALNLVVHVKLPACLRDELRVGLSHLRELTQVPGLISLTKILCTVLLHWKWFVASRSFGWKIECGHGLCSWTSSVAAAGPPVHTRRSVDQMSNALHVQNLSDLSTRWQSLA